jgi:transcriptional regulator with XRE-family HTH domain
MTPQAVERGRKLRDARERAGLTQKEAALRAGIHYTTLSDIENGKTKDVSFSIIERLTDLYGLSVGDLALENGERAREAPAVALGLPRPVRERIQEFLLELIRADVSDREVEEARRVLTSPELYRLMSGGEPADETEEQILTGVTGFSEVIKDTLRSRGYAFPK